MACAMPPLGRNRRVFALVTALLALHGALLAWSATQYSPVVCEVHHLPAGLSHLYLGRFELFRVNPPLVRTVAALPVALMSPATDWGRYDTSPYSRADFEVSSDFLAANGGRSLWFFTVARWACIPFSILGGYICFRWARELYGVLAGFVALMLWCFCPFILGHASLFTPDAPAAALGVTAYYLFWRWLHRTSLVGMGVVGIVLGLAELTKFTLLIFYPLWIVTWFLFKLPDRGQRNAKSWLSEGAMLMGMMLISVVVINAAYGFRGSMKPLGEFQYRSQLFSGTDHPRGTSVRGNRFGNTWLAPLPVPFPEDFLRGIDVQRLDFEWKNWSYLDGEWRLGGWWYYYLSALEKKLPLGTLFLIAISTACCLSPLYRSSWRNEVVLALPAIAILVLVSSQTGFSIHSRYVLPILPFAYIACGKVVRSVDAGHKIIAVGCAAALCWSVGSSLWVYPHSLSYFNELAGGPKGGHAHLVDSNIAWGQDLYFLRDWLAKHPEAKPFHLAYYGMLDPRLAGIEFSLPPVGPAFGTSRPSTSADAADTMGPLPGWYAVDMNHLHGAKLTAMDGQGGWQGVARDGYDLSYFQHFEPAAMAGYSIYVYHITPDEANRVRKKLGLRACVEADREKAMQMANCTDQ